MQVVNENTAHFPVPDYRTWFCCTGDAMDVYWQISFLWECIWYPVSSRSFKPCTFWFAPVLRSGGDILTALPDKNTLNNIILIAAIASFIISEVLIYLFSGDFNVILAHLLYFPILLGAFRFPRQAVLISVVVGLGYVAVVGLFFLTDIIELIPMMTQFYVYVSLTVVVSSLSMKMRMHEQRYRNVFDNSGNGICVLNGKTGKIIEQNDQCRILMDQMGYSGNESPDILRNNPSLLEFLNRMRNGEVVQGDEFSHNAADGSQTDLMIFAAPLPDGNIAVNIVDITERKNAERKIAEREEIFHFLTDNMVDPSLVFDEEGKILFGNGAAVRMSGLGTEAVLKTKHVQDFLISEASYQLHDGDNGVVGVDNTFRGTFDIKTFDGRLLCVEGLGKAITFHGVTGTIVTFRDITLQKEAEFRTSIQRDLGIGLASTGSIERASALSLSAAMKVAGLDWGGLYLSPAPGDAFYLISDENRAGTTAFPVPPSIPVDSEVGRVISRGEPVYDPTPPFEWEPLADIQPDGNRALGFVPLRGPDRTIGCIITGSHERDEISPEIQAELDTIAAQVGNAIARIQAEAVSRESRKNLQVLFDSLDDFLFVCDVGGHILYTNQVVESRLGYRVDELVQMHISEMHAPEIKDEVRQHCDVVLAGQIHVFSLPLMTKDGEMIPVETKVSKGVWGAEPAVFGISRDISERIRGETALRNRDAILDAVSYSAAHFLGDATWDAHITDVLQRLGEATQSSRAFVFQNVSDPASGALHAQNHGVWSAEGVQSLRDVESLRDVCYADRFGRWEDVLSRGGLISGNVCDFPDEERAFFEPYDIRSFMVVPVFVDREWWGFVGFYDCGSEREWTQAEIDALGTASGIIGAAIRRTLTDEVFRNPVEQSLVCTYILQDGTLRYVNPRGADIFGYERNAPPIGSDFGRFIHPDDLPAVEKNVRELLSDATGSAHTEFRGITQSGEVICCETYGTSINYMGAPAIVGTLLDITERRRSEERIAHLHQVILAVRNVNELLIREKNPERLVKEVCRTLTETRGYYSASIFLFEGDYVLLQTSQVGRDDTFLQEVRVISRDDLKPCCHEVLSSPGVFACRSPDEWCENQFVVPDDREYGQMSARLAHDGEIYGLLSISLPCDLATDPEEQEVFLEVAGDIAFSLHSISLEEERRRTEQELRIKNNAIASSISGIVIFDLNGIVTYANDAAVVLWGYDSPDEMPGLSMNELLAQRIQGSSLLGSLYETGAFIGEIEAIKKDGSFFIGQAYASDIIDEQGHPVCLMASVMDVTETRRAQEALEYSETLYRTIFGNSGTALAVLEEDGVISLANPTLETLFGYPLDEVEKHLRWDAFVAKQDCERIQEYFSAESAGEMHESGYFEVEMHDRAGNPLYGYISIDPIQGTPRYVISFVDITEQKNYEKQIKDSLDEKSVLLMEVHHRVKNNLQIISGLIKLQSLTIQDGEALSSLRECENRIMTMSLVHESLYQSENLAQINARNHLERLASNILHSETNASHISLEIDVEDLYLNLDTAIPCSLIVNELLTNSVKYAFDEETCGTILLSLHRDPEGILTLVVADTGRGLSPDFDINRATSLGLKLVVRLIHSQLKGTLEVDGANGATFTLRFPEKKKS